MPGESDVRDLTRKLLRSRSLAPIRGVRGVYSVELPFATVIPISEWHVIQESHPYAAFSHLSAIVLHGLTTTIPTEFVLMADGLADRGRTPLGTTPEDWVDLPLPRGFPLPIVRGSQVKWRQRRSEHGIGVVALQSEGLAVWATDLERTLIDAIEAPEDCGGVQVVMEVWTNAAKRINANRVMQHCEAMGGVLRKQRIGFLLELIGCEDPRLESWRNQSKRGGSAKLVASREFTPEHSERWNLSLNVPRDLLEAMRGLARG
jgi:predicted transcriptional regulator of viral defense system